MELIQQLRWRYSAKRMNGAIIPEDKIDNILEAIRLAPSSMGLQPFQILVVKNPQIKEKIFQEACGQPQIIECSHLLIFAGWDHLSEAKVDQYMENIAEIRAHEVEELADFKKSILKVLGNQEHQFIRDWSAKQVYIALGTAIDAAALSAVDATPMEGFNAQALDLLFQLPDRGLHSVVLLALGYRNEAKDDFAHVNKVRRRREEIFEFI